MSELSPADELKRCSHCKKPQPLANFGRCATNRDGLQYTCRTCRAAIKKVSVRKHLARLRPLMRARRLAYKFGITVQDYEAMFAAQGGVCAICSKPETRLHGRTDTLCSLNVDHDHETGALRGLLCNMCNIGIGRFDESPALLEKAAAYLRGHGKAG